MAGVGALRVGGESTPRLGPGAGKESTDLGWRSHGLLGRRERSNVVAGRLLEWGNDHRTSRRGGLGVSAGLGR